MKECLYLLYVNCYIISVIKTSQTTTFLYNLAKRLAITIYSWYQDYTRKYFWNNEKANVTDTFQETQINMAI